MQIKQNDKPRYLKKEKELLKILKISLTNQLLGGSWMNILDQDSEISTMNIIQNIFQENEALNQKSLKKSSKMNFLPLLKNQIT